MNRLPSLLCIEETWTILVPLEIRLFFFPRYLSMIGVATETTTAPMVMAEEAEQYTSLLLQRNTVRLC